MLHYNVFLKILMLLLLTSAFIYYNANPRADKKSPHRQKILIGGYELTIAAGVLCTLQIILYLYICLIAQFNINTPVLIINGVISAILIFIMLLNGFIRMFTTSKQLAVSLRITLLLLWWVPVVNLVLLIITCKIVNEEYNHTLKKQLLNEGRKEKEICKTKYPVLMVHGIFFRDWKHFNYWGRIPKELEINGARIFYGNQNSSSSVVQSASELKQRILSVIEETGCEKVNIIAHSKGGIDARYAISCLDMDGYVASLTTIGTPHRGCNFAGKVIEKAPEQVIAAIGKNYKRMFTKLGDNGSDFFSGVSELTAERCAELNEKMIDRENILYQSTGSKMSSAASAAFPLSVGYTVIKLLDGDNDGLVSIESMVWGNFLGIVSTPWKKGISHGDMIDLTRKNIRGFDVCEFYVKLVSDLKEKGL